MGAPGSIKKAKLEANKQKILERGQKKLAAKHKRKEKKNEDD